MRQPSEHHFTTSDGTRLFYRHWPALSAPDAGAGVPPRRAIVLFHRGHEHSGRLQHIVDELALPGVPMYAWDARGHGRTEGPRGYSPGIGTSVRDVEEFMRHVAADSGVPAEDTIVIAQSVGAVLAAAWVHDYAPRLRGLILASPAFKVKLYVPFARRSLDLFRKFKPLFYINSYVKAKFLTHDPERIASFEADPLITRAIAVNILCELYTTAERLVADAGAITVPTQLLISGADWVVHHGPQHEFFNNLGSPIRERHILDGFYHDTLGEKDRARAFEKMRAFIERLYADNAPPAADATDAGLLDADNRGYTANEHHRLRTPLPLLSARRIAYAITRINMSTLGRLGRGIRLGFETGFDSGSTLDYVYRNRPDGITPLGRFADKTYLNSIGWRGIRQRKVHAELLIRDALARLRAENRPLSIVDIAAGHGRYVLDAIRDEPGLTRVLLRDYSPLNVEQGRRLITERHLEALATFEQANAFDRASLAALADAQPPQHRPTLGIVSGLFELFPDNTLIEAALGGLADAIAPGGYLVYTNQPWHPQLEFIARVLSSHRDGQPWIMRRRTQQEMDALVRAAGFEKLDQRIDDWGIFSVSLARRSA
ncbi:lysophospholipase [Opitutaceae bacterium TAV1]|nr:lysophospholipase [Opitutaceae bacterium TAV1]